MRKESWIQKSVNIPRASALWFFFTVLAQAFDWAYFTLLAVLVLVWWIGDAIWFYLLNNEHKGEQS